MSWDIDFITEEQFEEHVENTINEYNVQLEDYDLVKFNKNIIDPVKLLLDKSVYGQSWEEIIENEIYRQRDKSNNNIIGYFHQTIFKYFNNCEVPNEGWDIVYTPDDKIEVVSGLEANVVYVELKNKHNTMNSSSSQKTYSRMQNALLKDAGNCCMLVEVIATKSQNVIWRVSMDKQPMSHERIRRVSLDKFYELVTGDELAYYKICKQLPITIDNILKDHGDSIIPKDTVFEELIEQATDEEISFTLSLFMLGFGSYNGFKDL